MATKEKQYTVAEGKTFHGIVEGQRTALNAGDKVVLTEDQVKAFPDVFVQTEQDQLVYQDAETPDGNPDTTQVVTQGNDKNENPPSPTIAPPAAGHAAPAPAGAKDQTPAQPVAATTQTGGGTNQSSSTQNNQAPAAGSGSPAT